MIKIVGVKFRPAGKIYYFDPADLPLPVGSYVIVETARGVEFGFVSVANKTVTDAEIVAPLKKIIRPATREDYDKLEKNKEAVDL